MVSKNPTGLSLLVRLLEIAADGQAESTARRLYEIFGGFSAVVDAEPRTLVREGGLSESTAMLIKLMPELVRRRLCLQHPMPRRISDPALCDTLRARYFGVMDEVLTVIAADANDRILDLCELEQGGPDSVGFQVSRTLKFAWEQRASKLVLVHNHPDGFAVPSHNDLVAQHLVSQLAQKADVEICRHIIVADDGCVDMPV